MVETLEQQLDELGPRAGPSFRERVRAQEHCRTDDLVRIRIPHTARMAAQQAELQLLGQLLRDRLRDEAPEAGIYTVGMFVPAVRSTVDDLARRAHLLARLVRQRSAPTLDRDRPDVLVRQLFAREPDRRGVRHAASLAPPLRYAFEHGGSGHRPS